MKATFFALLVWAAVLASAKGQTVTNSHGVITYTNLPLPAWLAGLSAQGATSSTPRVVSSVSTSQVETSRLAAAAVLRAPAGQAPTAPCKTPQALLVAVRAALQAQDTNSLWKLHCWTNVTLRDEAWHKHAAFSDNFKQRPGDQFSYSAFRLKGVEPGFNTPRPVRVRRAWYTSASLGSLTNTPLPAEIPSVNQYNIPVTGVITFKIKGSFPSQLDDKPMRFSSDNGLYFGKGPDGNFWLAVYIFVPKAKLAPSQQRERPRSVVQATARQVRMAERLRRETTMTLEWIARRLCKGAPTHGAALLQREQRRVQETQSAWC